MGIKKKAEKELTLVGVWSRKFAYVKDPFEYGSEAMGVIGAALLAQEVEKGDGTKFNVFEVSEANYRAASFECQACPSLCEIAQIYLDSKALAPWGGRYDLWEREPSS